MENFVFLFTQAEGKKLITVGRKRKNTYVVSSDLEGLQRSCTQN